MDNVRPSITDTAGWYPKQQKELTERIEMYMRNAKINVPDGKIIGIIVPHAGHIYSGQIAAYSFNSIKNLRPEIIAIISPSHFIGGADIILSGHTAYRTPLGEIEIETELVDKIASILHSEHGITSIKVSRDPEHSIEVELPFLQHIYDEFKLIPIMIRHQNRKVSKALGYVVSEVLKGRNSILVASSDLSHYYNLIVANRLDRELINRISGFDPDMVLQAEIDGVGQACGIGAIAAVLWASRNNGASKVEILKYGTSGDITGDYDEVVGYVSAIIV